MKTTSTCCPLETQLVRYAAINQTVGCRAAHVAATIIGLAACIVGVLALAITLPAIACVSTCIFSILTVVVASLLLVLGVNYLISQRGYKAARQQYATERRNLICALIERDSLLRGLALERIHLKRFALSTISLEEAKRVLQEKYEAELESREQYEKSVKRFSREYRELIQDENQLRKEFSKLRKEYVSLFQFQEKLQKAIDDAGIDLIFDEDEEEGVASTQEGTAGAATPEVSTPEEGDPEGKILKMTQL